MAASGDADLVVRVAANISALQADMVTAAASIKTIEQTTTAAATASAGWTSALNDLGRGFVARIAEGMLLRDAMREFITFGKEVLSAGSSIQKMADQTAIGTTEIQKLMYIAGQSDVSIESLVGAVQNLQVRLGDETTGAAGAMAKLKINLEAFGKLDTYAQMTTLGDAILALPTATEQASVAAALFGKTWKEILPAIKSGMAEVGEQAPIMANETIKALDRIDDGLKAVRAQAIAWGGSFVETVEGAGFAFGNFLSLFDPAHLGQSTAELLKLEAELNDPDGFKRALAELKPPVVAFGDAFKTLGATAPGDLGKIKLAEMDLTTAAEALIVVNKKQAEEAKKAADLQAKALEETTKLWDAYFTLRVEHGGTSNAIAIAQIDKWAADLTAQMVKAGTDTEEFYDSLAAVSKEKLDAVGVDWDVFKTKSISALQETADNALATYNAMVESGDFFRDALDQQLAKYHQLQDAARGYGQTAVAASEAAAAAAKKHADELVKITAAADAAKAAMLAMGNTYDIGHAARDPEIMKLLHDGWSLENAEALNLARQWGFQAKTYDKLGNLETTPSKAERVPGYETGGPTVPGLSMLHGGEYVVPKAGALVASGAGTAPQVINLVVDGRVLASIVNDHNTKTLKQSRQWPSA